VVHGGSSAEHQAREVNIVKRFETGFIMDPFVLRPSDTVEAAFKVREDSEDSTILVCEGGRMGNKLLGIVTSRDIDFVEDRSIRLADIMTPKAQMVFGKEPITLTKANSELVACKKGKLPILNEAGEVVALVSRHNLKKARDYPLASRDANRQLLVAAACDAGPESAERVKMLVEAGVDALVLNSSQGNSLRQIDFLRQVKDQYPSLDVICGNVVAPRQAKPLLDAGADALRVGMGCSSLCSSEACAVGRPQASAVYHTARFAAEQRSVPVVADGGVRGSGQLAMALALGASTVMCGSLLAGAAEAPGGAFYHEGRRMKLYRGAGLVGTAQDRETGPSAAAAVGGVVADRGPLGGLLPGLLEGVRGELRRLGAGSIPQLHEGLYSSSLRFQGRGPGPAGGAAR